jgi:hypothetical protein
MINCRARSDGVRLLGEANREAPAQAELRPTCAGPAMSKRQRVEWASGVNLHLIFNPPGPRDWLVIGAVGVREGREKQTANGIQKHLLT